MQLKCACSEWIGLSAGPCSVRGDVKGQHCLAEDTDFQVCQLIKAVKGVPTGYACPSKGTLKGCQHSVGGVFCHLRVLCTVV